LWNSDDQDIIQSKNRLQELSESKRKLCCAFISSL
jgi:hypothetical protein